MHKFAAFLTKYKMKLLKDIKFSDLQREKQKFTEKSQFDIKKEDLKKKIAACLTVIKEIIADDGKRGAFNSIKEPANEAIKYEKDKEEIDETKDSEWSKAEYEILQKYSENSNTIYISLGEIIGEYIFCDECIFFEDEEKGFFDEIKKGYNDKLKEEIQKSAQKAVNENQRIKSLILLHTAKSITKIDDAEIIDLAVDNMTVTEFEMFTSHSVVLAYIKKNNDKYKNNLIKKTKNLLNKVVTKNIEKLEAIASSA